MDEKRKFPRQETSQQCYIEKMHEDAGRIYSKVVNKSQFGMKLMSGCQYYPGETLKIVMSSQYSYLKIPDPDYRICRVKWCVEQEGYCNGMYVLGVEVADHKNAYGHIRFSGSG